MRNRITIQKPDDAASGWDGETTWGTYATVWASIRPVSGAEFASLRQEVGEVTNIITCRYLSGVSPEMRISYQGRYFDILAVMDIECRRRELSIQAREIYG